MQQLDNGYCSCYYLTEDGRLYNSDTELYKAADKRNNFYIKREDGSTKKIALKQLYKLVYGMNYCRDNTDTLEGEEWRDIDNTEGVYKVSNYGRVKSFAVYEAIIMKPTITPKGYCRLEIVQEGQRAAKLLHRLVAAAFLMQPKSIDMQLHHKDCNKLNNAAENLEWLTPQEHRKKHEERRIQENNAKGTSAEPESNTSS